ncbi:DUF4429 domain-containing protein [Streptomyces misionensis]|uniref:DUF4429 domain-containing protein n=1 Tax=Streptomyces misionensis TaxID=67331 RepID=A0A5C6JS50_9ACTN|nr:DUF4429 domain-containing protein [Streptomyces misionensis]TWV43364.1 DUF4429 domain-containing protein [Streptomyces misionensis]
MAEIIQKDGTWVFDGDALRLTPGRDKGVGLLRRELGELVVPLGALASVSVEQGKKSGWLRLRLREGADPLLRATGGRLGEADDPYRLSVQPDRYGVAEYFADEVRNALLLEGISPEPVTGYLLPGPPLPVSASAGDGSAHFDGERVRLEWNWKTEDVKAETGTRTIPLADILGVEWRPASGLENGHLRFLVRGTPVSARAKYDPNAVELWGFRKDPLMALVAAAVQARLPHPSVPESAGRRAELPAPEQGSVPRQGSVPEQGAAEDTHDTLLRRLRELGELRRDGVLTEEEFTLAKRAVLDKL